MKACCDGKWLLTIVLALATTAFTLGEVPGYTAFIQDGERITTPVADPPVGSTLYLPVVSKGLDSFEPNNTLQNAYGPLVSGITYSSFISKDSDIDYFSFDASVSGWMTLELRNINSPTTDLDLQFFDSDGRLVGGSYGQSSSETIRFLAVTTGRYYVKVYLCCGVNTPTQFYTLKATLDQPAGTGNIWGTLSNLGSPLANAPLSLRIYDPDQGYSRVFTKTGADGQFHFSGMPALGDGQTYQPYYQGILGMNYAGSAGGIVIHSYASGAELATGSLDVSAIQLVSPNSTEGAGLPVTFTWQPRTSSPSESYKIEIYSKISEDDWLSGLLGHVGSFNLTSLPNDFDLGQVYYWRIYGFNPDGTYAGSYAEYPVMFTTAGGAFLPGEPVADDTFRLDGDGDK